MSSSQNTEKKTITHKTKKKVKKKAQSTTISSNETKEVNELTNLLTQSYKIYVETNIYENELFEKLKDKINSDNTNEKIMYLFYRNIVKLDLFNYIADTEIADIIDTSIFKLIHKKDNLKKITII